MITFALKFKSFPYRMNFRTQVELPKGKQKSGIRTESCYLVLVLQKTSEICCWQISSVVM